MTHFDYDLVVIGAGSGGVRAARMAAQRGAKVAVVEAGPLGGTCVNVGCIPKKLYSYAAHYGEGFAESAGFGWVLDTPPRFDWDVLKANRAQEIARLNQVYGKLLAGAQVEVLLGWGRVLGGHYVEVVPTSGATPRNLSARHILIATGGKPQLPTITGSEHLISSNEIFDQRPFPQELVIVGAGYIACEFASIFNGLGARVHLLVRGEQILRGFDDDVRAFTAEEMRKAGVQIHTQTHLQAVEKTPAGLLVHTTDGQQFAADAVLSATGRVPNTQGMGLQEAGVALSANGAVQVNAEFQTSLPSVYALGDVSSHIQLTPVALREAMVVVDQLFGPPDGKAARSMDYEFIPTAVFTHPNIGTVGFTEEQARARFGQVTVFKSEFKALKHTLSGSSERTLMKLLVETATDRVVGLHMVGPDAGEVLQGYAVALRAGATKAVFDSTIGIHPTVAEEFVTMRDPLPAA